MATQKDNKRKKLKLYLTAIASSVVLVGVCAILAIPDTALAAKGSGGKKGSDFIQVMVDFVAGNAVESDGGGRIDPFRHVAPAIPLMENSGTTGIPVIRTVAEAVPVTVER